MKIALTNQDTINIEIQLDKESVTHDSTNYDFIQLTATIAEKVREHLNLLHTSLIQEENVRVELEKAASKKRRRFSNFGEEVSTTSSTTTTNSFKQAVTLVDVQKRLEKDGLLMNSGLPEVVRFRNSPYVYTVKATEWSSPFGSSGTEPTELLQDIAKNIYKLSDLDMLAFVLKYNE